MSYNEFFTGIAIGFSIAAPVGPVGLSVIRKTLQFGRISGFAAATGATLGAGLLAIISIFGVSLASNFLTQEAVWLRIFGGCVLLFLGFRTFFTPPSPQEDGLWYKNFFSDCLGVFLLNIMNPMTILPYIAVFAGLGVAREHGAYLSEILTILGVIVGSLIWWLFLVECVYYFRRKISQRMMVWVNRIAGSILIGFGLASWASILFISK
ncbi:MAG: LysE family transporter [Verrucomicrobia bacterium]|nr:LysE family transporter [Verrucomicrobiota bacterium]